MPETSREWDRRLDRSINDAANEARSNGNPKLADMLVEFRLAMTAWRDISLSRLRDLGVISFSREEHDRILQLVAEKTADKVVEEAKHQVQHRRDQWWQHWSVRVGVVVGLGSLLLSTIGTMVALFALLLRH